MSQSGRAAPPPHQPVRDHVFYGLTRSLCPECGKLVDAQVLLRDGAAYLRKRCPEHGWHEALVSSDSDWYARSGRYNKPGRLPHSFTASVDRGCPNDCGLCPEHQQHTCVGIIEITSRCDLRCPTCFADAGEGYDLTLAQVEAILDRLVEAEGTPEVVQISGGEPTLHPYLLDIVAAAKARGVRHVMLNTNGVRIAEDARFAARLAALRPVIYLQFDGVSGSTHEALRGRDLADVKRRALDRLADVEIPVVLVSTIARGVNEGEVGEILRFGLSHPAVVGVSYQPIVFCGRHDDGDPLDRVTVTEVIHNLETQTGGQFMVSDFIPVPCPHPVCSVCTYAFVDGDQVLPIPRLVDVDDYLDLVVNRAVPDFTDDIREAIQSLWSMAAAMGTESAVAGVRCLACCDVDLPLSVDSRFLRDHFFLVQVHGFMDENTFDLARLMKCCVHELLPDGRAVPFCAYNNLGIREQVRRELGRASQ